MSHASYASSSSSVTKCRTITRFHSPYLTSALLELTASDAFQHQAAKTALESITTAHLGASRHQRTAPSRRQRHQLLRRHQNTSFFLSLSISICSVSTRIGGGGEEEEEATGLPTATAAAKRAQKMSVDPANQKPDRDGRRK